MAIDTWKFDFAFVSNHLTNHVSKWPSRESMLQQKSFLRAGRGHRYIDEPCYRHWKVIEILFFKRFQQEGNFDDLAGEHDCSLGAKAWRGIAEC